MGLSISKSVSAFFALPAASGANIYLRQSSAGKNQYALAPASATAWS
jgi:hypothetical protein